MTVLVTGGAGYIGSHMCYALLDRGEGVCVIDNLSTGIRSLLPEGVAFFEGDVADTGFTSNVIRDQDVDAVIHFAGSVVVPESVANPLLYYANNTAASRALMSSCVAGSVRHFLFSSTAAVYGACGDVAVEETAPTVPINPYGRSKLMIEWMLEDVARAHGLGYSILRYFNVAGADPQGRTGQSTPRATHLIKRACEVALGRKPYLEIFGTDYRTPDGTGVRDYIHVSDLVNAHLLVLDSLRMGGPSTVYNCGYGHGFSVRDVVTAVERLTGQPLSVRNSPRRSGDAAAVLANAAKLRAQLHWQPRYDDLNHIVLSALNWERQTLQGVKLIDSGTRY